MSNEQKKALTRYLAVSVGHEAKERKLGGDRMLPMGDVFKTIRELRKHFTTKEIDYFIINKEKLAKQLLNTTGA